MTARERRLSERNQQLEAENFNHKNPVGTPIRYWSGAREGEGVTSKTRSDAFLICGHASVFVEGKAGSIALTHVDVMEGVLT